MSQNPISLEESGSRVALFKTVYLFFFVVIKTKLLVSTENFINQEIREHYQNVTIKKSV